MPQPAPDPPAAIAPALLRSRLDFDDAKLLAECDVFTHRTGGPGGQHRNKVETAIRLVHRPSGLVATASETRSQHENKVQALHRLREAIATDVRVPPPSAISWPPSVQVRDGKLRVNESNAAFCHVLGLVLDVFAGCNGQVAQAAARLGLTSSSMTRFLAAHPRAWREALRVRRDAGLPPIRS